jgi:hypothetical protein
LKDPPANGREYVEVTVYYSYVVGDGTLAGADKLVEIGEPYHTQEEADARCTRWSQEHKDSLRLTKTVERTVRVPVTRSGGTRKEPELARPEAAGKVPGAEDTKKAIRVSVFKAVGGKFERQKELEFETDDYNAASEYYWLAKSKEGYSATWQDSKGRKPKIVGAEKPWVDINPYNPPTTKIGENKPTETGSEDISKLKVNLIGTKWTMAVAGNRRPNEYYFFKDKMVRLVPPTPDLPDNDGQLKPLYRSEMDWKPTVDGFAIGEHGYAGSVSTDGKTMMVKVPRWGKDGRPTGEFWSETWRRQE